MKKYIFIIVLILILSGLYLKFGAKKIGENTNVIEKPTPGNNQAAAIPYGNID